MSRPNRSRIPTNAEGPLHQNPFAALSGLENLKPLPEPPPSSTPPQTPRLILRRERAKRGGKTVIVISGFPPSYPDIESIARSLRKQLGSGGTVTEQTIELQGDDPAPVRLALQALGFQVGGIS